MTISSLSASPYASLLTAQSSSSSSTSAASTASGSIGDQLLAALAQSEAASGASSDPLLQDFVSLSPAASGQSSTTPQTYNAQGLLQQVQSSMLLTDPLLQSDPSLQSDPLLQSNPSTASNTSNETLLQSLMSVPQMPTLTTPAAGAPNGAATTAADPTDPKAKLVQMLKQDPALAGVLVQSQMEQGMLSMLGP